MYGTNINPFGQGWSQAGGSAPSVAGALPSFGSSKSSNKIRLILSPASYVLDSVVYTADGATCVEIVTNGGRSTYFRKTDHSLLGEVSWGTQPTVAVNGVISQHVAINQWLRQSSSNNACRYMYARGRQFTWERQANGTSFILKDQQAQIASTVLDVNRNSITLEMTPDVISYGLSEVCIVAAALLYSNRI